MKKQLLNRLLVTRRKVSRTWSTYRTKKKHILSLRRMPDDLKQGLLREAREKTKEKISGYFLDYRERKVEIVNKSPFDGFSYTRKHETLHGVQKFYKSKKGYDPDRLDELVPEILDRRGVIGVQVIFKTYDADSDAVRYGSEYINKEQLAFIRSKGKSIYEHIVDKIRSMSSSDVSKFMAVHIRVFYA